MNEFHQFYCDYNNSTLDPYSDDFRVALQQEDGTALVIADTTKTVFQPQSIRAVLEKSDLIAELDDSFNITLKTDPLTLRTMATQSTVCQIKPKDCDQGCETFLEGSLSGNNILNCYFGTLELYKVSD